MNFTKIILCILSIFLFCNISSCTVYEGFTNPVGLSEYDSTSIILVQSHVTEGNISIFNTDTENINIIAYDLPYPEDAILTDLGDYYFVLRDGRVFNILITGGSFIDDYDTHFDYLGDTDGSNMDRDIIMDAYDNLFVNGGDIVYQLTAPSYSISTLVTIPHSNYPFTDNAASLAIHNDGILIGQRTKIGSTTQGTLPTRLYLWDGSLNQIGSVSHYFYSNNIYEIENMYSTLSGDVYLTLDNSLYRFNYSDSWSQTMLTSSLTSPTSNVIDNDGVIYISSASLDQINTYATVDLSGGFDYGLPPLPLMEFTNEPIEVNTYAHLECNLDDYWNTHANEHFYLSYDYYYKNMSNYTVIDYNELELNSQNTINIIPTYESYFNQEGGCEIKASILYTYHDPIYNEEQLGGIGYYVSTVLVNSTYEPPEEPEEPEEPKIPEPEPEPEPKPDPPIPPIQPNGTGANQSINVSWTGEYYNAVNNTFGGLCSPIYNFTNWSLSPIYSLNNSIGEFNYHMNESFIQTAQDSSILYESINTIFGAIHPKIRNVITYYLIWVVLLIILKKD